MSIFAEIGNAVAANWANWSFTTVVTLLGAYVGIRYQSRRQESVDEKEREQAKDEIISMMENRLINEKDISEDWIDNLVLAAERKYELRTLSQISPVSLLQELMFKIEESSHLDPDQKERYVNNIEETIEEVENSRKISRMSNSYSDLIEELRNEIQEENESALNVLESLEDKVIEEPPDKNREEQVSMTVDQAAAAAAGGTAFLLLGTSMFEIIGEISKISGVELFSFDPVMALLMIMLGTLIAALKWMIQMRKI